MVNEKLLIKFIETFYDKLIDQDYNNEGYDELEHVDIVDKLSEIVTIDIIRLFPEIPWTYYQIACCNKNITFEIRLNNPDIFYRNWPGKYITIQDILQYPDYFHDQFNDLSRYIPIQDIKKYSYLPWNKENVILYNKTTDIEYVKENIDEHILYKIINTYCTFRVSLVSNLLKILDKEFIELYMLNQDNLDWTRIFRYLDIDHIEYFPELLDECNYSTFQPYINHYNESIYKLYKNKDNYPNIYSKFYTHLDERIEGYRILYGDNKQEIKDSIKNNKFGIQYTFRRKVLEIIRDLQLFTIHELKELTEKYNRDYDYYSPDFSLKYLLENYELSDTNLDFYYLSEFLPIEDIINNPDPKVLGAVCNDDNYVSDQWNLLKVIARLGKEV